MKELLDSLKDFCDEFGMTIIVPCIIVGTVISVCVALRPAQVISQPEAEIGITDNTPLNRAAYLEVIDKLRQHEAEIQILQAREKEREKVLSKHEGWLEIVYSSIKDLRRKKK